LWFCPFAVFPLQLIWRDGAFRAGGLKFSAMVTAELDALERPAEANFNLNTLRIVRTVYPKQSRTAERSGSGDPFCCAVCRKIFITIHRGSLKVKRKNREKEK
jgi:hypothetical protein